MLPSGRKKRSFFEYPLNGNCLGDGLEFYTEELPPEEPLGLSYISNCPSNPSHTKKGNEERVVGKKNTMVWSRSVQSRSAILRHMGFFSQFVPSLYAGFLKKAYYRMASYFHLQNPFSLRKNWQEGEFETQDISSYETFMILNRHLQSEFQQRQQIELALISHEDHFFTRGFCFVCKNNVYFETDYLCSGQEIIEGKRIPNWRERVVCPMCHLNNRVR
ncbi:MAG: hypothetical protein R3351_00560, partial [Nitrospirales bacterium]|nr:hypothetical protein [Nitrospirales bacterium]